MSDITPKQQDVLDLLPNTRQNIADELGISYRAVRYRMNSLEEAGYDFERDGNEVWSVVGMSDREDPQRDTEVKRVNTYDKAQATKDVNNSLLEIEKEIKEAVENLPVQYPNYSNSSSQSTLVIPRSDDHFGVKIDSRSVNAEYSTPIARERINTIINRAIEHSEERGDVENVVLGLFGDTVDGENVYPGHVANLEDFLRGQIKKASSTYINQIQKLSEEFEHVKVVCVPGNHGNIGTISNADDIVYDQIELGVDLLELDNVSFVHSNGSYVNFNIRDYNGYARHGQDALEHASTSSGDDRWMNWKEDSDFDIAYHGHHHQLRMEPVGHSQLFQCGTLVPPSMFVDSIGASGVPRAFYHFTTDENMVEDMNIIDF